MADLRIGVLGPLELWRDGDRVEVPAGRRRAVLTCLVASAGRPVATDELIRAGWGDDLPDRPRGALNTVLSRLRTLLGDGVLRPHPVGQVLDVPADAVDAARFETLREQAATATPREAVRLLDEALSLWRGDAYAELADRDFVGPEAARLDLLRQQVVEMRAALLVDLGAPAEAVPGLEELLAEQPFREHAVHLLMTALHRSGRTRDALARYRGYRTLLAEELGLEPSPALHDLHQQVLGNELRPAAPGRTVPRPPRWLDRSTTFVGREEALSGLLDAVAGDRLVTVTGPGGVGKTRLVAEALDALVDELAVPVTVVELAPVPAGQEDAVDAALAEALGVSHRGGGARAACLDYLSIVEGLIVLDNCEHVLRPAAALADGIVRRCPRVRVLATSRHRFGMTAERALRLDPLPVPADGDVAGTADSPSVRLFADRVERARPGARVLGDGAAVVAEICGLLDGLPLALELAASRTATLGTGPVRDQLRLALGADPGQAPGPGYDELTAVVDWSHDLLPPAQQQLFAVLSVFVDDFDADAVLGVLEQLPDLRVDGVVEGLGELADASLLVTRQVGETVGYRMLSIVRARAARRLAGSGREAEVRCAHASWIREVVGQAAARQHELGSTAAFTPLEEVRADILEALRWCVTASEWATAEDITGHLLLCRQWSGGPEIDDLVLAVGAHAAASGDRRGSLALAAAGVVQAHRGELDAGRRIGEQALAGAGSADERFVARLVLGITSIYGGAHQESERWWREISTDDLTPAFRTEGHVSLALLACYRGDLGTARREADVARALAELAGHQGLAAFARYAQGEVAVKRDLAEGEALFGEAARTAELAGAAHVSRVARVARFAALVRLERHGEALELVGPLLSDVRRAGAWPQLWTTLRLLAELLAVRDRDRDAAFLLAAARASESGPPLVGDDVPRYRDLEQALRARLGTAVADGIEQLAAGLPRARVVDRVRAMLAVLET